MASTSLDTDLASRLGQRTLEVVNVRSESCNEGELARYITDVLTSGGVAVRDLGDTCLFVPPASTEPYVLLAGHLDTVPAQGNIPGRCRDGRVVGLGASDMKSGLAVMIELALAGAGYGYLFFPREEIHFKESSLGPLLAREAGLLKPHLAVMMEPTDNQIHAGCLGNINATWTFEGRSAHSARPWQGDNAIVRAAHAISAFAKHQPESHVYQGLEFVEVASVTRIEGGIADNIIPSTASTHINYRYPPGLNPSEAASKLRSICGSDGRLEITSNAPSASVALENPLLQRLIKDAELVVAPKQAWTPVAEFAAAGIDAVNFGPGSPAQAHQQDEYVEISALVDSYRALKRFL